MQCSCDFQLTGRPCFSHLQQNSARTSSCAEGAALTLQHLTILQCWLKDRSALASQTRPSGLYIWIKRNSYRLVSLHLSQGETYLGGLSWELVVTNKYSFKTMAFFFFCLSTNKYLIWFQAIFFHLSTKLKQVASPQYSLGFHPKWECQHMRKATYFFSFSFTNECLA